MDKLKIVGEKEIFKGKRVHLYTQDIEMPDGKVAVWDLVKHIGAAAVIAIDDEGKILMVEQYRNASDSITLEIPAGVLDEPGEDPINCAFRELEEETGYRTEHMEFLYKFYSSIGICDEIISIYVARDLIESVQNLDDDEFVDVKRYTLEELLEMCFDGRIMDNKTISALLAYKHQYGL